MKNDEGWDRVAEVIRGLTKNAATMAEKAALLGVSDHTVRKLEAGEPVVHATPRRQLANNLGWPLDALDRIRAGEDPADFAVPVEIEPSAAEELNERLSAVESSLAEIKAHLGIGKRAHLRAAHEGGDDPGAVPAGSPAPPKTPLPAKSAAKRPRPRKS